MTAKLPIVLLPGLEGTGDLFAAFVRVAPPRYEPIVIRLSASASYDELEAEVAPKLPVGRPFVILGESFSGPLALRLAASSSDVKAVIFSNSFVSSPGKPMLRFLPWRAFLSMRPPTWVIRRFLAGSEAPIGLVRELRSAAAKTAGNVLADRVRSVLRLQRPKPSPVPLLYLRGTRDDLVTESSVRETLSLFPNSERANIAAPHVLLQVAPEQAWSAIDDFLRRHSI